MRDYEVWDDTQDFFDKKLRTKSGGYFIDYKDDQRRTEKQLHCDAGVIDVPFQLDCPPFVSIMLDSSGEKQVTVRTYPKFFGTLGEIGGTAEILFVFVGLFYFKYNDYYLRKYIKSEVFRIESAVGLKEIFPESSSGKGAKRSKKSKDFVKVHPQGYQPPANSSGIFPQEKVKGKEKTKGRQRGFEDGSKTGHSSSLLKSNSSKIQSKFNQKSVNLEELIDKQIEQNMSGISLCKSLNHLQILMKIFFKPRHKKLLPVILFNLLSKESKNQGEGVVVGVQPSQDDETVDKEGEKEEGLTMEQAYERISDRLTESRSEVEKLMDDFFLQNAPDYFKKQPKKRKKSSFSSGDKKQEKMTDSQSFGELKTDKEDIESIDLEEGDQQPQNFENSPDYPNSEKRKNSFKSKNQPTPVGERQYSGPYNSTEIEGRLKKANFKKIKNSGNRMNRRRSQFLKGKRRRGTMFGLKKDNDRNYRGRNEGNGKIVVSGIKSIDSAD